MSQGSGQETASQPRATCRSQGRDLHLRCPSRESGSWERGTQLRPHTCPIGFSASRGSRADSLAQAASERVGGRGAGLDRQGEGGPWWNQTEWDPDLMFCVGNGVERLVWHHVTDYRWRGTRGKMSDAVEIAQPVGGGALTVAGKWRGRKRLQWGGVSSCQSRRAQHGAENGFRKNLGLIFWT